MRIKDIYYSSHFKRAFKKLPPEIKKQAIEKETIFRNNCFDPRLETHKLKGTLKKYWSFSVIYSHRILFEFIGKDKIAFIDIDHHSIYK